jgi:hypothetical protein
MCPQESTGIHGSADKGTYRFLVRSNNSSSLSFFSIGSLVLDSGLSLHDARVYHTCDGGQNMKSASMGKEIVQVAIIVKDIEDTARKPEKMIN